MRKGTRHKESSKELTRAKMKAWWQSPEGLAERRVSSAYRALLRQVAELSVHRGAGSDALDVGSARGDEPHVVGAEVVDISGGRAEEQHQR